MCILAMNCICIYCWNKNEASTKGWAVNSFSDAFINEVYKVSLHPVEKRVQFKIIGYTTKANLNNDHIYR